jgi:hypothetical protein
VVEHHLRHGYQEVPEPKRQVRLAVPPGGLYRLTWRADRRLVRESPEARYFGDEWLCAAMDRMIRGSRSSSQSLSGELLTSCGLFPLATETEG